MKPGLQVDDLLDDFDEEEAVAVAEDTSFTGETSPPVTQTQTPANRSISQAEVPATNVFKNKSPQDKKERQFVYSLDPHRCRAWRYHDRMEEALTADRCADLIDSIHKEGQKEPVVVRTIRNDPDHDYEIIFGRRRHFSCSYIKDKRDAHFTLKAIVKDVNDDQEAALLTWLENEGQTPITDFERGVYFRRLLGKMKGYEPVFTKQDDLRDKFEIDKGKMSKLVKCAELIDHPEIMSIIPDRTEIPFTYGYKLATVLDDSANRKKIISRAKQLKSQKQGRGLSTLHVIKTLLAAAETKPSAKPQVFSYKDKKNNEVLVCEHKGGGAATIKMNPSAGEISRTELMALFKSMLDNLYPK